MSFDTGEVLKRLQKIKVEACSPTPDNEDLLKTDPHGFSTAIHKQYEDFKGKEFGEVSDKQSIINYTNEFKSALELLEAHIQIAMVQSKRASNRDSATLSKIDAIYTATTKRIQSTREEIRKVADETRESVELDPTPTSPARRMPPRLLRRTSSVSLVTLDGIDPREFYASLTELGNSFKDEIKLDDMLPHAERIEALSEIERDYQTAKYNEAYGELNFSRLIQGNCARPKPKYEVSRDKVAERLLEKIKSHANPSTQAKITIAVAMAYDIKASISQNQSKHSELRQQMNESCDKMASQRDVTRSDLKKYEEEERTANNEIMSALYGTTITLLKDLENYITTITGLEEPANNLLTTLKEKASTLRDNYDRVRNSPFLSAAASDSGSSSDLSRRSSSPFLERTRSRKGASLLFPSPLHEGSTVRNRGNTDNESTDSDSYSDAVAILEGGDLVDDDSDSSWSNP